MDHDIGFAFQYELTNRVKIRYTKVLISIFNEFGNVRVKSDLSNAGIANQISLNPISKVTKSTMFP